jgi:H+/Cl- antiporter ClcA
MIRREAPGGDRVRSPKPVIARRLPSGRGATEQPNATGDHDAPLTPTVWLIICLTGIGAGLFGDLMMLILDTVAHVAFGDDSASFEDRVRHASSLRRIASLLLVGAIGGIAWRRIRGSMAGRSADVDNELWSGTANVSMRRSLATSVVSVLVVGGGASLGREAAPKLLGAASGSVLSRWRNLSVAQRRLVVACGGGAGMAAVYNVPLGGALVTAELLYGSLSLPVILPALACSWIATAVAWLYLPSHPTYVGIPQYQVHGSHVVFALVAGPLIGIVSVAWVRLIGWVSHHQVRSRWLYVTPMAAFAVLGILAIRYPQLMGNGQDMARDAFKLSGHADLALLAVLAVLKALATALCLGSGASGGLFTPTLSIGAVTGAALGTMWVGVWPGSPVGSYALIGAAAMIGAAMQTPLAALALVIELTGTADTLIVPMIAATMLATAVGRYLDGYSIYSSRLPAQSPLSS